MNKRLQTLLEIEHLSPSQFADTLGIQRGGVSHLLSGRNKPSFDFLQKVLTKFPDISAEWLVTGKGKPIHGNIGMNNASSAIDNNTQKSNIQNNTEENDLFHQHIPQPSDIKTVPLSTPDTAILEKTAPPQTGLETEVIKSIQTATQHTVKRIILYYSDGTYTDFYPDTTR